LFRIGLTLGLLIALTGLPAAADWLVTQDGDQVETQGPWEIKGKLVVFTLPGGTLSSMRLSDVDLDASNQLTTKKNMPAAPAVATTQRREATIVITDSDVAHVGPEAVPSSATERQEAGAEARAELAGAAASGEGLTVTEWNQEFDDGIDGVVVTGSVENRSSNLHSEITLQVMLYNTDGSLAGRAAATLDNILLRAGQSSSFRAAFAGIVGFDRPEFRLNSAPLSPRQDGSEGAAEGEIPADEEGDDDDDE
jgi:hypothetical protein